MNDVKYKAKRSDSVITPETRWAYPFVHEKSTTRPNGKPRNVPVWIITGLLPKLHHDPMQCANYQFLVRIVMEAASREPQWGGQFPAGGHLPIQDGDAPPKPKLGVPGQPAGPIDPNKGAWRKGHWLFEASTSLDPGPRVCVMQNGQAVEIPAKINPGTGRFFYKSGDFGHGSIHGYTFWNEKFGVSFGFEGILWTRDGEAIGSSGPRSAAAMFGGVAGTVAQPGLPVPNAGGVSPAAAYAPPALQPQYAPQPAPVAPTAPVYTPQPQYAAPVAPTYAPPVAAPPSPPSPVAMPPGAMAPAGGPPLPPFLR